MQGDMSVSDYCRKIKPLTNALEDVDQAVNDKTLVSHHSLWLEREVFVHGHALADVEAVPVLH